MLRAFRQERERARQYLDVAGVMLLVLDPDGRVSLINRMGAQMLGFTEEEIIGTDCLLPHVVTYQPRLPEEPAVDPGAQR